MHGLVLLLGYFASLGVPVLEFPTLQIEAPTELAAVRTRLQSIPSSRFGDIAEFLGSEAGPAIHIILATENSEFARSVVAWVSGFAVGDANLVVIFPARSPRYPNDSI